MTTPAEREMIKRAYDSAAQMYVKKYDDISPRVTDVDRTLAFATKTDPRVLEIGFGSGREARYILTKTPHYTGIDISEEMRTIADKHVSHGNFVCADVCTYEFVAPLDVVFAFASLLHCDRGDLRVILSRIASAMEPGGVVFLSLKRRDVYGSEEVDDGHVVRTFYYYSKADVLDCANTWFEPVYYDEQVLKEPWLTIILRRTEASATIAA